MDLGLHDCTKNYNILKFKLCRYFRTQRGGGMEEIKVKGFEIESIGEKKLRQFV